MKKHHPQKSPYVEAWYSYEYWVLHNYILDHELNGGRGWKSKAPYETSVIWREDKGVDPSAPLRDESVKRRRVWTLTNLYEVGSMERRRERGWTPLTHPLCPPKKSKTLASLKRETPQEKWSWYYVMHSTKHKSCRRIPLDWISNTI